MTDFGDADDMLRGALDLILSEGRSLSSRDGPCREVIAFTGALDDPTRGWPWSERRAASAAYGAAELLWYLSGSSDATMIRAYAPSYEKYLDDGKNAYGAYGKRWKDHDQLRAAYGLLKDSPTTRQAVVASWDPRDLRVAREGSSKDIPCTLSLQFLWRDQDLSLIATMRSNDAWLGMPYDVWCFTTIQRLMAACLGAGLGRYVHQVGSLHLYDRHRGAAIETVAEKYVIAPRRPSRALDECFDDLERAVGRALELERGVREGRIDKPEMIGALLGEGTILGEAVACCAAKILGRAPEWLDRRLLPKEKR